MSACCCRGRRCDSRGHCDPDPSATPFAGMPARKAHSLCIVPGRSGQFLARIHLRLWWQPKTRILVTHGGCRGRCLRDHPCSGQRRLAVQESGFLTTHHRRCVLFNWSRRSNTATDAVACCFQFSMIGSVIHPPFGQGHLCRAAARRACAISSCTLCHASPISGWSSSMGSGRNPKSR